MSYFQTKLCRIFYRFLGVRKFRIHIPRLGFKVSFFIKRKTDYNIIISCRFLAEFQKTGSHSRTRSGCHMSTFKSGHDMLNVAHVLFHHVMLVHGLLILVVVTCRVLINWYFKITYNEIVQISHLIFLKYMNPVADGARQRGLQPPNNFI